MPCGINYNQILNSLVVKPARAVFLFDLFVWSLGFYILNIVWKLEFIVFPETISLFPEKLLLEILRH
jgi:hypothetical protein